MNGEYVRIWKETAMAHFKILSLDLPGKTEENH